MMAKQVIMPKQGLQMTEGTITKWLLPEGGAAIEGEPLFEIETDKLTITINSSATGTLLKILKGEGEIVPITHVIAVIGEPGEDISSLVSQPAATAISTPAAAVTETPAHSAVSTNAQTAARKPGERIFISPRAKMRAAEAGTDISKLNGSGPDGMIIERDVLSVPKVTEPERQGHMIKFDGMRRTIASRLAQSWHDAVQANHRMTVDMTEAVKLREDLKNKADLKISYNDIITTAAAKALRKFPILNSSFTGEGIYVYDDINIGFAVAVEDGLVVPVIREADRKSLGTVAREAAELAAKARTGKLEPDEYTGGTFTISNLGMYDLDEFTAIINPPECAILAIGKIAPAAVPDRDGNISVKPMMTMSLTYDHRAVDGAPAAQFLQLIKEYLQNPFLLM